AHLEHVLGVERYRGDMFSAEPSKPDHAPDLEKEGAIVTRFLQAILDQSAVHIRYRSPYRDAESETEIRPLGAFWDRERWYLVGDRAHAPGEHRLWRADRVLDLATHSQGESEASDKSFDIGAML